MGWKKDKDDATERWSQAWQDQRAGRELPELPTALRRELHDQLRDAGGQCDDNCGHFDHNGRSRDKP